VLSVIFLLLKYAPNIFLIQYFIYIEIYIISIQIIIKMCTYRNFFIIKILLKCI